MMSLPAQVAALAVKLVRHGGPNQVFLNALMLCQHIDRFTRNGYCLGLVF